MTVVRILFRLYRPIILWFAAIITTVEVAGVALILQVDPLRYSLWLVLAGSAAKWWLLVVGIMLVAMQFRHFVANGVTRRAFAAGAGVFGLVLVAGFGVAVTLGHALESAVLGLLDQRAADYPVFHLGDLAGDFAGITPNSLAYFVSGALFATVVQRFRPLIGVPLLIPSALPMTAADTTLGFGEYGAAVDHLLPYAPALLITLAVTALGAAALHRAMRDIPIRRTAG